MINRKRLRRNVARLSERKAATEWQRPTSSRKPYVASPMSQALCRQPFVASLERIPLGGGLCDVPRASAVQAPLPRERLKGVARPRLRRGRLFHSV